MDPLPAVLALAAVLCIFGGLGGLFLTRARTLSRRVASFSCLLRLEGAPETAWRPGVAQYGTGRLMWWSTISLAPRPALTWSRADLDLLAREPLGQSDDAGRPLLLLHCAHRGEAFDVIVSAPACAGLVSWLESAPRTLGRVS